MYKKWIMYIYVYKFWWSLRGSFLSNYPRDSSSQLLTISSFSSMNVSVLLSPFIFGCPTLHNSNIIIYLITPRTTILTRSASSKKKSSVSASRFSSQACCAALQADASFSSSPSPSWLFLKRKEGSEGLAQSINRIYKMEWFINMPWEHESATGQTLK
jgi:hypothetical protein